MSPTLSCPCCAAANCAASGPPGRHDTGRPLHRRTHRCLSRLAGREPCQPVPMEPSLLSGTGTLLIINVSGGDTFTSAQRCTAGRGGVGAKSQEFRRTFDFPFSERLLVARSLSSCTTAILIQSRVGGPWDFVRIVSYIRGRGTDVGPTGGTRDHGRTVARRCTRSRYTEVRASLGVWFSILAVSPFLCRGWQLFSLTLPRRVQRSRTAYGCTARGFDFDFRCHRREKARAWAGPR